MTAAPPPQAAADDGVAVFAREHRRLFGLAYRILGSWAEAEDVVQDAWLRWQAYDRGTVLDPPAFLTTTVARLAITVGQSARARRETYLGPWLPEPVDTTADPQLGAERGEALELAVLLLLERLGPTERAAYVLRTAFDYPYGEIAGILDLTEANARQLVSRARKHLAGGRGRPVDPAEQRRLLTAFVAAARTGDLAALEKLLAAEVVSWTDGNGMVGAARVPVPGRDRVARFAAFSAKRFWTGTTLTWTETNGRASVLVARDGALLALVTVGASTDGIDHVLWVMSPAKLARFAPPAG